MCVPTMLRRCKDVAAVEAEFAINPKFYFVGHDAVSAPYIQDGEYRPRP